MPGPKPVIGVSIGFHEFGDYLAVGFHRPIVAAGGVPVILPRVTGGLDDVLDVCDGLLLSGGRDILPEHYGQEMTDAIGNTDPRRDLFELDLARRAIDRGMPLLGICRGMQVLNVALGGSLHQDVNNVAEWSQHPSDKTLEVWRTMLASSLDDTPPPTEYPKHEIVIAGDSLLYQAVGAHTLEVSSFHHQALDQVAAGLRVTAFAPDGVAEAIEVDGDGWVLAMQCETHEDARTDPAFGRIFEHFIAAAAGTRPR